MTEAIIWDHMTRPVRDDDAKIFAQMTSRTLYADLPSELRRYSAETFDDKYKRLGWDELSRSITAHLAKDGYWYIHPEQLRTLTVREAARIQTFPDHFRFAGTRSDAFRQIGNAVPPFLGHAAASALKPLPEPRGVQPGALVPRWREARHELTRWANEQRVGRYWYLLPGEDVSPAVAAASALLCSHVRTGAEQAIGVIRGRVRICTQDVVHMKAKLATSAGRVAIERFLPLAQSRKIWTDVDGLRDTLNLKPAQERLFRLLCGQDVMVANQSALRVAARVAGTDSDKINRMSNGRIDLARLVGAAPDAPLRTAAVRLLGMTVCLQTKRQCGICPLSSYCASASTQTPDGREDVLF